MTPKTLVKKLLIQALAIQLHKGDVVFINGHLYEAHLYEGEIINNRYVTACRFCLLGSLCDGLVAEVCTYLCEFSGLNYHLVLVK